MWPFRSKSLEELLFKGKRVKVHGVFFQIRKVNPLDYLTGAKALRQDFNTYEAKRPDLLKEATKAHIDQMKQHYADVFLSAVLYPKLKRDDDDLPGIWVENLFTDWNLASDLYQEIMFHTYGKKKMKQEYGSLGKRL